MDLIKRLFLIFILVFAIFSFNSANCNEIVSADCAFISSIQAQDKILLNQNDDLIIDIIQNSNTNINSRRNNSENTANNDANLVEIDNFDNIISYLYNQVYLDDKNELALLFLLHQIQPNAP